MVALPSTFRSPGDWLTIALPRSAVDCYGLFCDVERTPEWLTVLASAVVTKRHHDGRAREVAFQARLERATIGYSCRYSYEPHAKTVAWSTPPDATLALRGLAQFQASAPGSCLMTYALDVRRNTWLPPFADTTFELHASSAALAEFRDFVKHA